MKISFLLFFSFSSMVLVSVISCSSGMPHPDSLSNSEHKRWKLIWQEEFNYTGLPDPDIWTFETVGNEWGWGNGEDQYYTSRRIKNARVADGVLTITAHRENYTEGFKYTSARIKTQFNGDWLYGRFVIRAKQPEGQGIWPAIWMMPTDSEYGSWPDSGEIDIMEFFGFEPGIVQHNIHTEAYNHKIGTHKGTKVSVPNLHSAFHIYELQWYPDRLEFYTDGRMNFTYHKKREEPAVWPYDKPFYIILNCAVGGDWIKQNGGIDDSIFPQSLSIDYVRVYQDLKPGPKKLVIKSDEGGSVSVRPHKDYYFPGEKIRIQAKAARGYRFSEWAGEVTGGANPRDVVLTRDKRIDALFVRENELLKNGSFTKGLAHWNFWHKKETISCEQGVRDAVYSIDVKKTAHEYWSAQLSQEISVGAGRTYVVDFYARAESDRIMRMGIVQNYEPYHSYFSRTVKLSKNLKKYSYSYTPEKDDAAGRLEFDFGDERGVVYIHDVSLSVK